MKSIVPKLHSISLWISAVILAVLPFVVAIEYAGVLPWTQWAASLLILTAVVFAIPGLFDHEVQHGLSFYFLLPILILWAAFAYLQTVPLPSSIVGLLSPASAESYTKWTEPILGSSPAWFPISIDPFHSKIAVANLFMLIPLVWTSIIVFQARARVAMLMCVVAIGCAVIAGLGIFHIVSPSLDVFEMNPVRVEGSFAGFVNRNSAALMMNFGIGASLGLLSWRLSALIGQEIDDENFEFNDLLSLMSDRDSSFGVISLVFCASAILVGGSRGGVVAAIIGGTLAFGWIRSRRGFVSIPVVIAVVAICIAILLVPLQIDLKSLDRLELLAEQDKTTLLNDGRILHWKDAIDVIAAYFPAGSGLATYQHAHLPYLDSTTMGGLCAHAENVWLEFFSEQGIVGMIVAFVLLTAVGYGLVKLDESPDPVDHGLRVAGWYFLGAIVASQMFDFGMIVPANFLLCAVVLCVVATRRYLVAPPETDENKGKIKFRVEQPHTIPIVIAVVSILPIFWSIATLKEAASVDAAVREARFLTRTDTPDPMLLQRAADTLRPLASESQSPEALAMLCKLNHQLGRYAEVAAAQPRSAKQIAKLYEETEPDVRRLTWNKENGRKISDISIRGDDPLANQLYQEAYECAQSQILARPLSREGRSALIYLDFVHKNSRTTKNALEQLISLYSYQRSRLQVIAKLAIDSGEYQVASDCMRKWLEEVPRDTHRALELAAESDQLDPNDFLPTTHEASRVACRYLIDQKPIDTDLLSKLIANVSCDQCETLAKRSECESLRGEAFFLLDRLAESNQAYEEAIRYDSGNATLRVRYINLLIKQGDQKEALAEARKGRVVSPEDQRFSNIIERIAADQLRALRSGN